MTWRRFHILLAGLGPNSAVVNKCSAAVRTKRDGKPAARRITDKVEAEKAVQAWLKGR
jgi:hypothetical protein